MNAILLLSLFILSAFAFSQEYPDSNSYCQSVPYYDYALCAKGMKDTSGNIILEPRYSEITLLPGDLLLVCENEKYGVLNCAFEIVIPIIYKRLRWQAKYNQEIRCSDNYWFFETDEGSGMMNSDLEVVFPPVYDEISRVFLESQIKTHYYSHNGYGVIPETASFFRLTLNGKSSICNEFGKEVVSDRFEKINCYGEYYPKPTHKLPSGIFFLAKDDSTQTIISENGDELFKAPIYSELYVFTLDSSTIVKTTDRERITRTVCLESGVSISTELDTYYNDPLFLYQLNGDQSFHIYGKNLRHLYSGEKWYQDSEYLAAKDETFIKLITGDKRTILFSRNGEVLFQTEDKVFATNSETDGCLWTVPELKTGQADTLRIYFPSGKLKREYIIRGIEPNHFFEKRQGSDDYEKLDELLFVQRGAKWGALDRNGDLKIPFGHDRFGIPYGSIEHRHGRIEEEHLIGYYVTKAGKMGAIDRFGEQVYPCKYDTLFSAAIDLRNNPRLNATGWPEYFRVDETYHCSFAIKKNSLYTFIEGKKRLCDSSFLAFGGPLQLVGDVLIDVNGQIIREIKDGTIHKSPTFFLYLQGDVAQVILFSGKMGLTIEQFKSAQVEGDYLKIKLNDETMGVLSLDGTRWLYAPKYYDISFTNFPPNHAWVKEDTLQTFMSYSVKRLETYDGCWKLVDTSYTRLYDFPFKFPLNVTHDPSAIFESDNCIGMIDSSLNLVFQPEYEMIYETRYADYSLLYADNLWQLGHSSGAIFNERFNGICYKEVNNTIAVFSFIDHDTLIGFLTFEDGFNWKVPMTEMHQLINTTSLRTSLGTEVNLGQSPVGLNPMIDSLDRWRVQNNELIVNYALHNQRRIRDLSGYELRFIPDFEFNDPIDISIHQKFFENVNMLEFGNYVESTIEQPEVQPEVQKDFHKTNYYPKCICPKFYTQELLSSAILSSCYSYNQVETMNNFVYLDSIQKVELSDILVLDEKIGAFLQAFSLREFTENQSGVEVCPDLEKTEALMWSRFNFSTGGIQFSDLNMFLTYAELEPYLTPLGKRLNPW